VAMVALMDDATALRRVYDIVTRKTEKLNICLRICCTRQVNSSVMKGKKKRREA
jgi:hypothetical protein